MFSRVLTTFSRVSKTRRSFARERRLLPPVIVVYRDPNISNHLTALHRCGGSDVRVDSDPGAEPLSRTCADQGGT